MVFQDLNLIFPRLYIVFHEFCADGQPSEAYTCINNYLGTKSIKEAQILRAEKTRNSKSLEFTLVGGDEVEDEFQNVKVLWVSSEETVEHKGGGSGNGRPFEKRQFVLEVHSKHRDIVMGDYLNYVMEEGKDIQYQNKKRRLYTNNKDRGYTRRSPKWNSINFQHPATFHTLGMDPLKKKEILDDLNWFKSGEYYYKKVGKAWKRGYLLYGPPGTGKSTMIAAMANFLDYDIYNFELTPVKGNADLKELLIETSNKSIIVIEDKDCSLNLTGTRKKNEEGGNDSMQKKSKLEDPKKSKVTLSGLLNFIDGIWSACGEERIIIFTTNHIENLDPALIRRGRIDMDIEMSHCKFEAFKVLAKSYLGIEEHPLFEKISDLLEENDVTPCDVAENLMLRGISRKHVTSCLQRLTEAIKANHKSNEEKEETEEVRGQKDTTLSDEEKEEKGEVQDQNDTTLSDDSEENDDNESGSA